MSAVSVDTRMLGGLEQSSLWWTTLPSPDSLSTAYVGPLDFYFIHAKKLTFLSILITL